MREKEIRERIWNIIEQEIKRSHYAVHGKRTNTRIEEAITAIRTRINKLLNTQQAILVYQP